MNDLKYKYYSDFDSDKKLLVIYSEINKKI